MHPELADLFEADRREHADPGTPGTPAYEALRRRDAERRARASAILRDGRPGDPVDWYRAAWLFHHGDAPEDAEDARRWAGRAMAAGHAPARWLYAAAYDRWCMYRGRPQRFGTQIVPDGRRHRVWDVDPATTDEERAEFDVPPLAEQHRRAEELTRTSPQPPMDLAPGWLKAALARRAEDDALPGGPMPPEA